MQMEQRRGLTEKGREAVAAVGCGATQPDGLGEIGATGRDGKTMGTDVSASGKTGWKPRMRFRMRFECARHTEDACIAKQKLKGVYRN